MIDFSQFARPELAAMKPYEFSVETGLIRLDSNESPFDWPPELKEALGWELQAVPFNRYPGRLRLEVQRLIADMHGVGPEQVVMGNGLDEVITMLMQAFGSGRRVVVQKPSFSEYKAAALVQGACLVEVPLGPGLRVEVESLAAAASGEPCIVMLCNPHNPTCGRVSSEQVEALVKATRSLIVVDEAYVDFSGDSALRLLEAYPERLVVLRTLSKAFGMAGVRLGYSISGAELAQELEKVRQPFNLDCLSLAAAKVGLGCVWRRDEAVAAILAERARMEEAMDAMPGVKRLPSSANFILFEVGAGDAAPGWERLKRRGVMVRRFPSEPALRRYLRVTVGTPEENDAFLAALREGGAER